MAFADMYRRQLLEDQSPEAAMAGDDSMPQAPQGAPASLDGILRLAAVQKGLPPALLKQIQPMIQQRIQSMTAPSAPAARPPASQPSDAPGGVPAPAAAAPKAIPGGYNELDLQKLLADQGKHADEADAIANEYAKRGDELNLAPIAGLVDSWTGSKLSQGYTPPPTRDERLATLAALKDKATSQRQKMTSDLIQLTKSGNTSENANFRTLAGLLGSAYGKKDQYDIGKEKQLDKLDKEMMDAYSLTKTRGSYYGKLPERLQNVRAAERVLYQYPKGDLDSARMQSFATQLAKIEANSNVFTEGMVNGLLPYTGAGIVSRVKKFFTNKPEPAQVQEFVKAMYNDLMAEKDTIKSQITAARDQTSPHFLPLKAARPGVHKTYEDAFENALNGVDKTKGLVAPEGSIYKYTPGSGFTPTAKEEGAAPATKGFTPVIVEDTDGVRHRISDQNTLDEALKDKAKVVK